MNKNLNWTDNRVLGAAGPAAPVTPQPTGVSPATYQATPNTGVSPATYQAAPNTGVSPATYQAAPNTGVSPATYQAAPNTGVSPATYQKPETGVSPATYQKPNNAGVSPETYQKKDTSGVSPATYPGTAAMPSTMPSATTPSYQDMAGTPYTGMGPTGVSPDTGMAPTGISPSAGVGMQAIPTQPGMTNETLGAITRNSAYAPTPITGEPGPPSVMDPGYIPGYLRTQIGKRVRAEFLFTNQYLDKTGILRYVGYNYFVLEDNATHAMIMCDLYSARFVTSAPMS